MGTVEAGTCGALRMQAIGVVDGREAIVIEHVTRLAPDVAPDWPTLPERPRLSRGDHRHTRHRLHDRRDASGPQEGRDREHDLRGGRDGGHRDARRERGPVCRCRTAGPGQLRRPAVDDSAWSVQPTRVSFKGISTSRTLLKPHAPLGPSVLSPASPYRDVWLDINASSTIQPRKVMLADAADHDAVDHHRFELDSTACRCCSEFDVIHAGIAATSPDTYPGHGGVPSLGGAGAGTSPARAASPCRQQHVLQGRCSARAALAVVGPGQNRRDMLTFGRTTPARVRRRDFSDEA